MNINFCIDEIPKYKDGSLFWMLFLENSLLQPGGFNPEFSINEESGAIAQADEAMSLEIELQWTYPLAYMELISGDGRNVNR